VVFLIRNTRHLDAREEALIVRQTMSGPGAKTLIIKLLDEGSLRYANTSNRHRGMVYSARPST
jgi:hypothetical protein